MEVIEDIDNFANEGLALTIGFFDGLHAGHRYLIDEISNIAKEEGLKSAVFTFWPHPRIVLNDRYKPKLLNTKEEKLEQLSATQLDYCVMTEFTMKLADMSAYDFMKFLREKLNVRHLVVGYDHRFGRNREEGFEDYRTYGEELGMKVTQADPYTDNKYTISSSFIRQLLAVGEVNMANHYLGYPYSFGGTIVDGNKIGRTLGYPTANIKLDADNKMLPKIGVYAVLVETNGARYKAMMYIGTRPTAQMGDETSIEVCLFNFDGDLYGKKMTVYIIDHVRNEHKFENMDALKEQLRKDKQMVLSMLRLY